MTQQRWHDASVVLVPLLYKSVVANHLRTRGLVPHARNSWQSNRKWCEDQASRGGENNKTMDDRTLKTIDEIRRHSSPRRQSDQRHHDPFADFTTFMEVIWRF